MTMVGFECRKVGSVASRARDPASRVQIPSKIPGAPLRQFYAERRIWHGAGVVLQDLFRT